jgi:3-oxoacyl-[acyl-carrier protein] reductase
VGTYCSRASPRSSTALEATSGRPWRAHSGGRAPLTGRRFAPLHATAQEIVSGGGRAEAVVDATDHGQVEAHFASVIDVAGSVDVSFNMIAIEDVQGQELVDTAVANYLRPIELGARTQFLTATIGLDT